MEIKIFNRGENIQLTKDFHLKEFECKCKECKYTLVHIDHVKKLQEFRDQIDKTIKINSAYRCCGHNFKIGGESQSFHLIGTATDIMIPGDRIQDYKDILDSMFVGMGIYTTFIHVDSRETQKARWNKI